MANDRGSQRAPAACPHQASADYLPASRVTACVRGGISVYDVRDVIDASASGIPEDAAVAMREVARWIEGFVNRPHPALGRTGEVCPWTRRTADLGRLLIAPIASDDAAEVDAIVLALLERFWSMEPTGGADAGFRSIIGVLHRLNPETAAAFVVAAHTRLKPTFLDRGLMLGEFYPTCTKPGLRNPSFRPLASPVPLLVIRQMVEADVEFLLDRDEFVDAYLRTHRSRGAERLVRVLEQRPASVTSERVPGLLRLAAAYRDSLRPPRSSPRPTA